MVRAWRGLITSIDEIIAEGFDDFRRLTGLGLLVVRGDEDGFVGLDADDAACALFAINAPLVAFESHILHASEVEAVRPDPGRIR